jgi:hypothetical protein
MHKPGQRCTDLIEMTAKALSRELVIARVVKHAKQLERNVRRTLTGV